MQCYEEVEGEVCPRPPLICGDQFCDRPVPYWEVSPSNPCILIPKFDWSQACPANTMEPVSFNDGKEKNCELKVPTGYGFKTISNQELTKICWQMRYCASSCTQTTQPDGVMQNRFVAGCGASGDPGTTPLFKAKCNAGVSTGDVNGDESIVWKICTGPLGLCTAPE